MSGQHGISPDIAAIIVGATDPSDKADGTVIGENARPATTNVANNLDMKIDLRILRRSHSRDEMKSWIVITKSPDMTICYFDIIQPQYSQFP